MTEKRKQAFRVYAILSLVLVILSAAVTVFVGFLVARSAQPEPTAPPTEPTLPQSDYQTADFTWEGNFLQCMAADTAVGIDVSRYQGTIDWDQVKQAGISFVMVRLGYRTIGTGTLEADPMAAANLAGARAAGLQVGAYFYSQAVSAEEAAAEAELALQILDGFSLDLPLAFDWEIEARTETVTPQTATDCALVFCHRVEAAGYTAMVYFNSYQAQQRLELARLTEYPWWLAMYDIQADFPCRFDMWQYSCTGSVPGIQGEVDLDLMLQ